MRKITDFVNKTGSLFDLIAGWLIVSLVILVVMNVILRTLINQPISGTYEFVGFFTAVVISFSLANCALQNSHISIDYFVERFPKNIREQLTIILNFISAGLMTIISYQLMTYALKIKASGQISSTTQTLVYPFILLTALGFFLLVIVEVNRLIKSIKKVISK